MTSYSSVLAIMNCGFDEYLQKPDNEYGAIKNVETVKYSLGQNL